VNAPVDHGGVVDVDPAHLVGAGRVPDADERQLGVLQPANPGVLEADLHQNDSVDAPSGEEALERSVVVAPGGGQQDVQVGTGRGFDHAGHKTQLHVGQTPAGGRDHQADGPGPAFLEGAGSGVGPVPELVDDLLDALSRGIRDRALAAERVGDCAPRDARPSGDLPDVHRCPHGNGVALIRWWRARVAPMVEPIR
jgi:hypothetical protein